MVNKTIYLAYHLDKLRKQKGYCVEEFVFGICLTDNIEDIFQEKI